MHYAILASPVRDGGSGEPCEPIGALREQPLFLCLFLLLFFLCACLCGFLLCLCLVADLLFLLVLGVVNAHARQLVLDCHDRVAQEHTALRAVHDGKELLRCLRTETRAVAAVTDRFRDAVGAAVDLCKDGGEQCRAGGAELAALRTVVLPAVYAEGLTDVFLFLRNVVLEFGRLTLREEAGKDAHCVHLCFRLIYIGLYYSPFGHFTDFFWKKQVCVTFALKWGTMNAYNSSGGCDAYE